MAASADHTKPALLVSILPQQSANLRLINKHLWNVDPSIKADFYLAFARTLLFASISVLMTRSGRPGVRGWLLMVGRVVSESYREAPVRQRKI